MNTIMHGYITSIPDIDYTPKEIDLANMAYKSLNYLINNPRPALDFECRFGIDLMSGKVWPSDREHEIITIGDTDLRMLIEYQYMKEMTGSSEADSISEGLWKRCLSYLDKKYNCKVTSGCCNNADQPYINPWSTGKLLIALCNYYRIHPDDSIPKLCHHIYESLCDHSIKEGDAICYPNGNGFYHLDGTPAISNETPYSPSMQPESIAVYAETFSDSEALEFGHALARGEMKGMMAKYWILNDINKLNSQQMDELGRMADNPTLYTLPDPSKFLLLVRNDGSFDHHSHMRCHNVWGISHIAYLTEDTDLIQWCKNVLDFCLSRGTDYGWIPESMTYPRRSETCAVADVISIALYLAKCGYRQYYDTVERFIRNYIFKAQFFITDEYKDLYLSRHPGKTGEKGLAEAKKIEGGFLGAVGINDRLYDDIHMDMMGCCAPEGMRSIYSAWKNIVSEEHSHTSINMNFSVKTEEADVESLLPNTGGVKVTAKNTGEYQIRYAGWADAESISVFVNNKKIQYDLADDGYVIICDIKSGDEIIVSYPVKSYKQNMSVKNEKGKADRDITVIWRGSTVVDVQPYGYYLPFYKLY